ncbi:M20/M25/M40 family metallo-hydrolase [Gordonibacter urolithinfaciens]|uniref:M20/M25/M40 family metallo-hydrolase n=1 Tax=Gordonibacter urolithinfaciens TaxID=1335613 RepID=A0A6N8IEL0_9ACTN|nr:M20/M25/M40 family metallo-hydrolase [Gordonibacter urolithinfaciens]MVM55191.1 M20/M25/M40 family metallo-hydrolase [Gordonibacter urolithinfaciens]MVN14238.1 M20/M25/M40 family metallo-hydrolase [Gordonibacter urolithinfaciens]MVN39010.1 M20/M25/M40 family metallo-hydrolase [Gordonibacter urolithinfaciens]MVN55907.1 M20/M25/M40 family metallo-hydrolase [Gordonibacter urolithinfaciens]MVN60149.1 M20/M25/M40 family metallo-hydrolase [Gordonibacter urolithinfaciens]
MNPIRLLDLFCEIVRIESPSRHEAAMAARCADELRGLGFSVRFDDSAAQTGADTGNLVAHLPGTAPGHVVLSAHMDTVQPCAGIEPVVEDGVVRSAGDTILSADDKAGVAAILEGVRSVVEEGAPRPDVTVLLTTCEELHLLGSGALAPDALPAGAPCYVLDADGAPGTVITGAPCHWTLEAVFAGRASHAGVVPEAGISAIQMAAVAIGAMPLGRIDEATTANIGVIAGGRETNVVPEACMLRGECRSLYPERAEAQKAAMTVALEQAAARFGGTVGIDWTPSYGAVLYDEDDALVQAAARAARAAGLEPCFRHDGGGSDANVLAARGVRAVTLGVGMTAFHSPEEHISVADLEGTARLVEALVREGAE